MKPFKISTKLSLPSEAVTWVNAFLAKRGAGKTYCAAVLAEEMLKQNVPIVVLDGMGIWWGLRVRKDGKGNGLPIVVFGGEHGDLPFPAEKAKQIANSIVTANISAVLDLSGMSKGQSRRAVADFLDELYKINRVERHIFIEETDMYAPQRVIGPEQATCLGAVDNFVRRGGNHNLGCTLITQRSAVLNKDILTQSDCLVILRTLAPQDKKAIQAWVEEQTDESHAKLNKWYDSLKALENGQAWVWHPEDPQIYEKIIFRERETFHATRKFLLSPQAVNIKLMDVQDFIDKFRSVFEVKSVVAPKAIQKPVFIQTPQMGTPMTDNLPISESQDATVQLNIRKPDIGLAVRKPTLQASDRDVLGKILYAITQGGFDVRQTLPKAVNVLSQFGWLQERTEVENALVQLCDLKFFTRKISTGNMFWYTLCPDAKQRIAVAEVQEI
jgi:hypothetical protein